MIDSASDHERVRQFVTSNFYVPDGAKLDDTTPLIEAGILDSTGVLELVTFIESTFGIQVGDEELVPANFGSIQALCTFIGRKRG
ncbi:MAG TPA: acyl carrier protein [Kofleriaceae bacterium]|nr:acyl carrier protein [Kofleriaceae bacterium]